MIERSRDGLGQLLRAEWTKLRSVRGWGITLLAAVGLTLLVSLFGASSSGAINDGTGPPKGPGGELVFDDFHFTHQPLAGDGTVTARVLTLTGRDGQLHEWAKAGVMIKESTRPGSPYAAVMLTPEHGVRMQSNFTRDMAGGTGTGPRWLRLTRAGETITGYESTDGTNWREVGEVTLRGLPRTVEVGLFVASPAVERFERQFGSTSSGFGPTFGTATLDGVTMTPDPQPAAWRGEDIGEAADGATTEAGGVFTLTGSGDIRPAPVDDELTQLSLTGVYIGLIAIVAVAVLFITSEYKRGMIRTTFAASPRRGRVLAAKALVIGAATFAVGLVATVGAFLIAVPILRDNGFTGPMFPKPSLSDPLVLRSVVGTAAILALVAVFSLGLGAMLRRSAGAIAVVVVVFVVPQLLLSALPLKVAQWVMAATPAAGFSIQDTSARYDHVADVCLPETGCYIQEPWVGFAVLVAYAGAALAAAWLLIRRRDA